MVIFGQFLPKVFPAYVFPSSLQALRASTGLLYWTNAYPLCMEIPNICPYCPNIASTSSFFKATVFKLPTNTLQCAPAGSLVTFPGTGAATGRGAGPLCGGGTGLGGPCKGPGGPGLGGIPGGPEFGGRAIGLCPGIGPGGLPWGPGPGGRPWGPGPGGRPAGPG